jgi:hypothetical protein
VTPDLDSVSDLPFSASSFTFFTLVESTDFDKDLSFSALVTVS